MVYLGSVPSILSGPLLPQALLGVIHELLSTVSGITPRAPQGLAQQQEALVYIILNLI